MARKLKHLGAGELRDITRVIDERPKQSPPRRAVNAERLGGAIKVAPGDSGAPIVEGLSVGDLRDHKIDSLRELKRSKKARRQRERVDGGTDIVPESGQRQLRGSCAATDGVVPLVNPNGQPGPREHNRGGEAVRPGSNDCRVHFSHD
jgi:hypothetical protein